MKKTLSLVLAAVLAFGSAVSAFAAFPNSTDAKLISGLYRLNSDGEMEQRLDNTMTYGSTFGFMITDADGTTVATKSDHVKNLKPYTTYTIPNTSTLVEKVQIEYKKYKVIASSPAAFAYGYFATVKTKANTSASSTDLYGELGIGSSKANADTTPRGKQSFTVTLENNKQDPATTYTAGKVETNWTLDFENQNDVEIDFFNLANYIVDATGQSKLNCGFTTKFNSEFSAKYPAANLEFLTFGAKPSFNRIGELTIYSEEGKYLYELTADGFKEPKYTYDEDYEAFVIKTRTLGAYIMSDIELEPEVVTETPAPSVPGQNPPTGGTTGDVNNGGKPNPNTGR